MRPLQALNLAMIRASSMGDDALVEQLYAMRKNPADIGRLLLALDSTPDEAQSQTFADMSGQYGCVMLPLAGEDADFITALGARIRANDLHERGVEWEPHVTALHGVHDQSAAGVGDVCKGYTPIAVRLGACGVFPATPQKPYDVLKVAVDSPDLMALNHGLSRLPHTESYAFNPHCTIAYLKPGRAAAYAARFGNLARELVLSCVLYSDPIKRLTAFPLGATESFADWKEGTSPATGEHGWISSGGQFRKQKPQGSDDEAKPDQDHAKNVNQLGDTVAASLTASEPELKDNPGLVAKVKDAAITAGAHVLLAMQRFQDHWSGKVIAELVDAYFDSPNDMKKLGYNPGNSAQTSSPKVRDDVSANIADAIGIGLSGHLVAKIAAEVLSRGFLFLRNKFRGQAQGMAEEHSVEEVAQVLADLYNQVNKSLGLDGVNDPKTIAEAIRKLQAGKAPAEPVKMADDAPTELKPVTGNEGTKPASSEVALAGKDGAALNRVIQKAKDYGVSRVNAVMQQAAKRYSGDGPFLNDDETKEVASAIAAVNATAELLGRSRVRELQDRAESAHVGDDEPFHKFADDTGNLAAPETAIATPEAALSYFQNLYPKIGVDPERFAGEQNRRAFTLAATMDQNVTADIKKRITSALKDHTGTADAAHAIQQALNSAGVTPANPQYAEMVFRTNAMDAYQTGAYEEGQSKDVEDIFPCYQYLGIRDGRQGKDHEAHFDKYYPRTRAFADVRGPRVFNCRCSLRWVDQFEWADLLAKGAKMEGRG